MKKFIVIVTVMLVLVLHAMAALAVVVPINGAAPTLTPVTINNGPGDQFNPHVSGDWAAYSSDFSIRYYNFATNTDAEISLGASSHDLLSDVSGSKVVFSRVIIGVKTAVMVFDCATAAAPIEIDPASGTNRLGSAIGSNTVAYIDFGLQPNGELVIHDLAADTSVRITNDEISDQNQSVSPNGNVVTWEHCATSTVNCDIWQAVKSGLVWSVSIVSDSISPEANPDTNGSTVVYDSRRGTDSDLYWRPVSGGGPEVQMEMAGFQNNPRIAGNYIAFESRATLFDTTDIFVYDLGDNHLYQITNTPLVTEQLNDITVLPDGRVRVVWASDEDGYDQRNIKGATFQLPNVAPTLSFSTDAGYGTDGVSPDSGSRPTLFTYKVVYADYENHAPATIQVCVDGICSGMSPDAGAAASFSDGNYKDGEQYTYDTNLSSGEHDYYFEASDGTDTARFPASGVLNGPSVSNLMITTTSPLPGGTVGTSYSVTVTATGGTLPYNWDLGGLPPGLTMDFAAGTISGTPTAAGIYVFTIFVADSVGNYDSKIFTITVSADSTPPVIAAHADVTAEATSGAGATVTYTSPATTDAVDGPGTASCLPASGSLFPLGNTTVTCSAADAHGNAATPTTFVVHVVDTTPPVLTVPANITVNATSPSGAAVSYVVTATDAVDPNPTVRCAPASGSTFPVGTTAVTCTATDAFGNSSSTASFNVVVKGASDQITELIALVKSFNLKQGIGNSLYAKLQNVFDALNAANMATACNKLGAFINEVLAQSGKALTTAQANQLITAANQVKTVLGCP